MPIELRTANAFQYSAKGVATAELTKSAIQLYAAYEGYITVWDLKIARRASNLLPKSPTTVRDHPRLPKRMKSVYKVQLPIKTLIRFYGGGSHHGSLSLYI